MKDSNNTILWIPALWWYEMINVLTGAERRKRIHHAKALKVISLFDQLDLKTDNSSGAQFSHRIYELARMYQLSAYDATYLELSIRKETELVSIDSQLMNAASICL